MIVRKKGKFIVKSKDTGREFGTYKTLPEAKARLRQIEMFKYLKPRK